MKKRFLAALLSLVMLLTASVPATVHAAGYVYPSVSVTLLPDEMTAMEMEFRQWAAEVIFMYYAGSYQAMEDGTSIGEPYGEYYRLASTKNNFDKNNVLDEDIIYNVMRDEDWTEIEGVYTWVLIESLKEAVTMNEEAIIANYNDRDEEDRKYLVFDSEDGDLKVDDIAVATHEQAWRQSISAWGDFLADAALAITDGMIEWYTTEAQKANGLYELISGLIEAGDDLVESVSEGIKANAAVMAHNVAREVMIEGLASQLYGLNEEMVYFLRNTYTGNDTIVMYGHAALVDEFIDMIDPSTNPELQKMLAEQAISTSTRYSVAIDIVDNLGQELYGLMDVDTMLALGAIEAYGEILKSAIDAVNGALDMGEGKRYVRVGKNKEIPVSWATISEIVLEPVGEIVDRAINQAIDELYTEFENGQSLDWNYAVSKVNNKLVEAFSDGTAWDIMAANLIEAIPGIADDVMADLTGGASGFDMIANFFEAILDSEVTYAMQSDEMTWDDVLKFISNVFEACDKAYWDISESSVATEKMADILTDKDTAEKFLKEVENPSRSKRTQAQGTIRSAKAKMQIKNLSVLLNICDRIYEAECSLIKAVASTSALLNDEGILSLWSSRVSSARNLSSGVRTQGRGVIHNWLTDRGADAQQFASYAFLKNLEEIPLEEVVEVVSDIHMQLKYDIIGTRSYKDIAFHGFYARDFDDAEFWKYINKNHVNVFGGLGLINSERALERYNEVVEFYQEYYVNRWKTEWKIFLDGAWEGAK